MTYRYHSVRCKHGFCLETVGCEECRVRVPDRAGQHLRRASLRRVASSMEAPATYKHQGKRAGEGNGNARVRY